MLDFQNVKHIEAVPQTQPQSNILPSITTSKQGSVIQAFTIVPSYLPVHSNIVACNIAIHFWLIILAIHTLLIAIIMEVIRS